MPVPDRTPINRFPDLEKPGRGMLNQLFRLFILTTRGDILTRGATYLKRLALGTSGKVLHSDGTDVEWATLLASEVEVSELGTATYDDVQNFINFFGDRTILDGGTITAHGDADGKVVIAACKAWCKVTDSGTAIGKFFDFAGKVSQTLTDLQANFIYLDYNAGTPQVVVATTLLTYGQKLDHILLGVVFRNGTATHIHNTDPIGISGIGRSNLHWLEHFLVHRVAGAVTSSVGTRQLAVTAGVVYAGLSRITTNAFNTSTGDTFSYWYYDGDLGTPAWVEVTGQTAISNTQYNDVDTGLVNLSAAAKRGVHWAYLDNDGVHIHVVYGQDDYSTANAELATVPTTLPPLVTNYCVLIAKIIVQKDQDTLYISYPWTEAFQTSLATDHGSLAGLGDDDHTQYLLKSLYDAQSVIIALTDDTPIRLSMSGKRVLGRTATGDLTALTGANLWTILTGEAAAAVSLNNQKFTEVLAISEVDSSELTIDTDGAVVAGQMFHTIDTENDDATDDLVTISNAAKIAFVFIRPNNDARTIVVKHNTGNIWLQNEADITLDDIEDGLLLVWDDDNSKWFDIAGGGGGAPDAHASTHESGGSDQIHSMADDDDDTKIQVEESADEDIIRMDVAGVEAFHLSAVGELTLAKQSCARAYPGTAQQKIPTNTWVQTKLDAENFDIQNEFDITITSSTATAGTSGTTLVDSSAPFVAGDVGKTVWNDTDGGSTTIAAFASTSEVTLTADIGIASGEAYSFGKSRFTATEAGKYMIVLQVSYPSAQTVADKTWYVAIKKNGAFWMGVIQHSSVATTIYAFANDIIDLAANDYLDHWVWHQAGSTKEIDDGYDHTFLSIVKVV